MIGALSGIGRVVGREVLEETAGRLVADRTAEDLFTREEIARRIGQKSGELLVQKFKEAMERMEDEQNENEDRQSQIDWNKRMNDFARNLNKKYRQNTTLYKEERNIQNKNAIEDRFGLSNAYRSPSGLYKTGNTLYVSGTGGKDGSFVRDWMDNFGKLPFRRAEDTEKYKDVMKMLEKNPDVNRLVSHSLGSAVVNRINELQPNRFATTTYATPAVKPKRKGKQDPRHKDYRNPHDVVSALDGYAITSDYDVKNPLTAHGYMNFAENGLWHIRPSTRIDNGFNPNA